MGTTQKKTSQYKTHNTQSKVVESD